MAAGGAAGVMSRPLSAYGDVMGQLQGEAMGNFGTAYNQVRDRALEDAATQANLAYSNMGRYGSGSHTGAVVQGVGDLASRMDLAQMGNARSQLLDYGNALPGAYQSSMLPYDTLRDVGGAYEAQQANILNDEARRFYEAQQAPWDTVAQKNALLSGTGKLGGVAKGTATTPQPGWGERALGYTAMVGGGK